MAAKKRRRRKCKICGASGGRIVTGRCIACYYYLRRTGREREDLAIAKATEAFEASFASDPAVKLAERLEIQRIFAKARARLP